MCRKGVVYARVSSEGQADNTSIQEQLEKARSYCKTYDIDILVELQDVSTGANTDREGYRNLKDYIQTNKVDVIICYKLDRLHRSLKNLIIDKEELESQKINIVSVMEQIDTSSAQGKLFFNIIGSFAEFEKDIINQRTSAGKVAKINKGEFTAGRVPFGYILENSSYIYIDDEKAETVKKIFDDRIAGKSIRDIAGEVKIPKSTVDYIIKNKAYIGKMEQEKGKIIDIPAIISKYKFDKANKKYL